MDKRKKKFLVSGRSNPLTVRYPGYLLNKIVSSKDENLIKNFFGEIMGSLS
jgi:hypothetical protein